jgi:NADH:ubiquinone oxidoreductase subunit K
MTFIDSYKFYVDIIFWISLSLAALYLTLSLIYVAYRYSKGDDIPSMDDLSLNNLSVIRHYINPFYFKHPVDVITTAMCIFSIPYIVAASWPVLIPLALLCYFIQRTRKLNLEKKKMWGRLKS